MEVVCEVVCPACLPHPQGLCFWELSLEASAIQILLQAPIFIGQCMVCVRNSDHHSIRYEVKLKNILGKNDSLHFSDAEYEVILDGS
jgi:hypothetical protein